MSNKQTYHSPSNKSNFEPVATRLKVSTLSASNTHNSRKQSTNSQTNFSDKNKSSQLYPQAKKSPTNQNANRLQIPEIRVNNVKVPNQSRKSLKSKNNSRSRIKNGLNEDYEGFIEEPYAREKAAAQTTRKSSVDNSALFRKKIPSRTNTKMKSATNNDYQRFSQKPPLREQSIRPHKTPESNHSFHNRQPAFSSQRQRRSPSILKHKQNSDSFTFTTKNGKGECECAPAFYSSFLGPTADEVILNGLKALRMLYDSVVSCRRGVEAFDEPEIIRQMSSRGASFSTPEELSEALIAMDVEPEEAEKIASKHFSSLIPEIRGKSSKQLSTDDPSLVDNATSVQGIYSFDPTIQSFISRKSSKSKSGTLDEPEEKEEIEQEEEETEEEEPEEEPEEEVEEEKEEEEKEEEEEEKEKEESCHSISNRSPSIASRRRSSCRDSPCNSISTTKPSQHSAKSNHSNQDSSSSCENISEKESCEPSMINRFVGSDSIGFSEGFSLISREMSDKGEQVTIGGLSARSLSEQTPTQTIIKHCKCCKCGVKESANIGSICGDDIEKKRCYNTTCKNMRCVSTTTLPRSRSSSISNESTICRKLRRMCRGFSERD